MGATDAALICSALIRALVDYDPPMRKGIIAAGAYIIVLLFMVLVVRHGQLPDEAAGMDPSAGPVNALLQQASGKDVTTDFLVDYASALALRHGDDPYQVSAVIFDHEGLLNWAVGTGNPHPPTMIVLALPFALLHYQNALAVWTILMIFALIWTVHLVGVRLVIAAPIGLAIAATFPGAAGIGNAVPLIGLGIAIAYRYRDNPIVAALGLALAAAPKYSGLLLVIPFVLTRRWAAAAWTIGFMATLAVIPLAFFHQTWSTYFDAGVYAISLNALRDDNASLLNLANKFGLPSSVAVGSLVIIALVVALRIKDTFWPIVWLAVAALPITWMYSILTLIPLFVVSVRQRNPWALGSTILATALAVGSSPYGLWPVRVVPVILVLAAIALLQIDEPNFWPSHDLRDALSGFFRRGRFSPASGPAALPAMDGAVPGSGGEIAPTPPVDA